jgi:hypothetical protein
MKKSISFVAFCAVMALATINHAQAQMAAKLDNSLNTPVKVSRVGKTEKEFLRVIFLAGSDYNHFRIGMENVSKSPVNIEVTDENGAIVYTDRMKRVYKRVKEVDFSFLKRGEYVVRVFNQDNEFSKVLRVP